APRPPPDRSGLRSPPTARTRPAGSAAPAGAGSATDLEPPEPLPWLNPFARYVVHSGPHRSGGDRSSQPLEALTVPLGHQLNGAAVVPVPHPTRDPRGACLLHDEHAEADSLNPPTHDAVE